MLVISDTGPLRYLVEIGEDHILPALFGRVVAPPAVIAELSHAISPQMIRDWAAQPPAWLEVVAPAQLDPTLRLDAGEAEAISLAMQLRADALLIDERDGTRAARSRGLFTTGTLGILDLAAEKGIIVLPQVIDKLAGTSFRRPQLIIKEMLERDRSRRAP